MGCSSNPKDSTGSIGSNGLIGPIESSGPYSSSNHSGSFGSSSRLLRHQLKVAWPSITAALLILLISYLIFPLLDGLVLGMVFAYVGRPIKDLFRSRCRLGAVVATFSIIIPLSAIASIGVVEMVGQLQWILGHQSDLLRTASRYVVDHPFLQVVYEDLAGGVNHLLVTAASVATSFPLMGLGRSLSMGIINFLISFPVCYFLLVDGSGLKWAVMAFLPTEKAGTYEKYLIRIDRVISGVYMGSIYTAIAGGLTSAVIFYLFGVPRPLALASIVSLAGMVPFLTWLVFIPTTIFRYYTIGPLDAVLFFLAGSTLVHLAELLIRPYLVSAASSIHPLLVLISFMGGGMVAGMAGFFLAPALVGVIVGTYQVMAEEAEMRRRSGLCSEPGEDGLGEEPGDASRIEGMDNAAKDDAAKIQQS